MKIDIYIYGEENTPSSRLRWINFLEDFVGDKIEVEILKIKDYFNKRFFLRKEINQADIIIIQKYVVPNLVLKKIKRKCKMLIFDVDDLIWNKHPNSKTSRLKDTLYDAIINHIFFNSLKVYEKVIVSNNYLKNELRLYNDNISVIPTSPSDKEINSIVKERFKGKFIVGWTGTKSNFIYLRSIEEYIVKFLNEKENAYLLIISDGKYLTENKNANKKIINIKWDIRTEASYIKEFDIGIMPLIKDDWSKGKAAFKLIYYMKYSIATIATNWGYQTEFIESNQNGILVDNNEEWYTELNNLYANQDFKRKISINGSETYEKQFSKEIIYEMIKDALLFE